MILRITKDILQQVLVQWEQEGRDRGWPIPDQEKSPEQLAAENIEHVWAKLEVLALPGDGG